MHSCVRRSASILFSLEFLSFIAFLFIRPRSAFTVYLICLCFVGTSVLCKQSWCEPVLSRLCRGMLGKDLGGRLSHNIACRLLSGHCLLAEPSARCVRWLLRMTVTFRKSLTLYLGSLASLFSLSLSFFLFLLTLMSHNHSSLLHCLNSGFYTVCSLRIVVICLLAAHPLSVLLLFTWNCTFLPLFSSLAHTSTPLFSSCAFSHTAPESPAVDEPACSADSAHRHRRTEHHIARGPVGMVPEDCVKVPGRGHQRLVVVVVKWSRSLRNHSPPPPSIYVSKYSLEGGMEGRKGKKSRKFRSCLVGRWFPLTKVILGFFTANVFDSSSKYRFEDCCRTHNRQSDFDLCCCQFHGLKVQSSDTLLLCLWCATALPRFVHRV